MEEILIDLGLETCVDTFKENEVGPRELLMLTESEFDELGIPAIGKRARLRNRCRLFIEEDSPEFQLRRRRGRSTAGTRNETVSNKPTRRLTVGWITISADGVSSLVNYSKGGGPHKVDVPKFSTLEDLKDIITNVFFPSGHSSLQNLSLSDVDVTLTKFSGEPLPDILRNGEIFTADGYCEQIERYPVRVYLQTVRKENRVQETADNDGVLGTQGSNGSPPNVLPRQDREILELRRPTQSPVSAVPRTEDHLFNRGSADEEMSSDSFEFVDADGSTFYFGRSSENLRTIDNSNISELSAEEKELNTGFFDLVECLNNEEQITVTRCRLLEDVFRIYSDCAVPTKRIRVKFVGERGDDQGGLTKDFLTNSWRVILQAYFQGEDAVVPFLPLHKARQDKDKFIMIGRILSHTAALLHIVPPRLSRTTLLCMVFGDESVSEYLLLQDYLLYLSPVDRRLVSAAMTNFDSLTTSRKDDLMTFYSIHNLHEMPSASKIREQILSIAQEILVNKPRPLLLKMKQGIPELHYQLFWSLLTEIGVTALFRRQRPTPQKVIAAMKTLVEDLRPDEERSLYVFKQYISSLDQEELSDLLLFVTGSTCMPDEIIISFRNVVGEGRCPVAHTCSNFLELPSSYSSVQDLKREFRSFLTSPYAFDMSIM